MSNSTRRVVQLCALALLFGFSSSTAFAQVFYTAPGAGDFEAGVNECADPTEPCELQDAVAQARDYLDGANTTATIRFAAGTYQEDVDFDQVVLNSQDADDEYVFEGYDYDSGLVEDVTVTLAGDEYDFIVGNIEQTSATGVLNLATTLELNGVVFRLTGEPEINFADNSLIEATGIGDFVINSSNDVPLLIAEPDPTLGDLTPSVTIEVLSVLGSGTTSLGVIDRFGPVNDPQLMVSERLTVDNGTLMSRDGTLVLDIDADYLDSLDGLDDDDQLVVVTIAGDGTVNFDDIEVDIDDIGNDETVIFAQTGTVTSNGLIVTSAAGLAVFNFTEINGPVDVTLEDADSDITFTNLTQIGDDNALNTFVGAIDFDLDGEYASTVTFERSVDVLGDVSFESLDLTLSATGLGAGMERTQFTEDVTFNNVDVYLDMQTSPTRYHSLSILGDVSVDGETDIESESPGTVGTFFTSYSLPYNIDELFDNGGIVGNAVFLEGSNDAELFLDADLIVDYLVINKGDDGDEVEIDGVGGNLVIGDNLSVGGDFGELNGGLLVVLEGELTTNARLDAGEALVVLDEGGELDRGANETVYITDDADSLPAILVYTGDDFTRTTGDEIEQLDELNALGVAILDGRLLLDEDVVLTEGLLLSEGTLDVTGGDDRIAFEIASTADNDIFPIVVENGFIDGDDANIVYPSEYSSDFEAGEDGLWLLYVGADDRAVTAEFPNDRLDEVVYFEKTGSGTLTLMGGETYRVNGPIDVENGTFDIEGATLEMRGFNDSPTLFVAENADVVDTAADTTAGALRFIGEGALYAFLDDDNGDRTRAFALPATEVELDLNDTSTTNDFVHFFGDEEANVTFRALTVISADLRADDDNVAGVGFAPSLQDVTVLGDYTQQGGEVEFSNHGDLFVDNDVLISGGELNIRIGDDEFTVQDNDLFVIGGSYIQTGGDVDFEAENIQVFNAVAANDEPSALYFGGGDLEGFHIEEDFQQTGGTFDFLYAAVMDVDGTDGVGEADTTGYNFSVTEGAAFYAQDESWLYVAGDFNFTGESNLRDGDDDAVSNAFDGELFFDGEMTQLVHVSTMEAEDQFDLAVVYDARFDHVTLQGDGGVRLLSDIAIDTDGSITLQNGNVDTQINTYDVFILSTATEDMTTLQGGVFGQRNNPADIDDNVIRLGSRDSYVDGTVTRWITGDQASGGVVNEGYFFPVGLETEERSVFAPMLLQFGTEGRTTTAQVTTFGRDEADADVQYAIDSFDAFAVPLTEENEDGLVLNVLGDLFYKVEFDAIPSTDPNIRIIADFLSRGVVNQVRQLRVVQLPCADGPQFEARLAGIYDLTPGDPDDASFGLNDFINGVPNIVQEGVAVQECQVFAVSSNSFVNNLDGSQVGTVANVQLIHAAPEAPEVDVYVNDFLATSLSYLEATPYTTLPVDSEVEIYLADSDTSAVDAVFTTTLDVAENGNYVIAVTGTAASGLGLTVKDNARMAALNPGTVEFFLIHAVPGADDVDVVSLDINNNANDIFANNLGYGEASSYNIEQPDRYTFSVQAQDGTTLEAVEFALADYQEQALSFVIAPIAGGEGIQVAGFDANGNRIGGQVVTDVEGPSELPVEFTLHGNYPNPFNPSTSIQFDLPQTAEVTIEVIDMLGRRVMMLPAKTMQAGSNQQVRVDAQALSSGTYIYRVTAKAGQETSVATGRMVLLK